MGRSLILAFLAGSLWAGETYFQVLDTEVARGEKDASIVVAAQFAQPCRGFSLALRHNCPGCKITEVTTEGTLAEEAEFVESLPDNEENTLVAGVLMDYLPPFDGTFLPALPEAQPVLKILLQVSPDTEKGNYDFTFVPEGLRSGNAWIENVCIVREESVRVTDLRPGTLKVSDRPQNGLPLFLRGDANQDLVLDLSDAIFILGFTWRSPDPPPCYDACDVNDDGWIDIADPIYLLNFLFAAGPPPLPPAGKPGLDYTPDPFDCAEPAAGYEEDFWPSN